MNKEVTIINNKEILLFPGDRIRIEVPTQRYLPFAVYTTENDFMGYLGVNRFTTCVGSTPSTELFDLLDNFDVVEGVVKQKGKSNAPKMIAILSLEEKIPA